MSSDDADKTQVRELKSLLQAEPEARQAYLIVISGAEIGRMHRLRPGITTIGRSRSAELVLEEEGVSRAHAELSTGAGGDYYVRDCGSTNGTLVNGQALTQVRRKLVDGDKVQVGGTVILKFSYQDHLEESFQQRLYSSAVRDALTGVYNKRYLTERLDQEFSYAQRHRTPMSLVVLDLDHFKRINDTYGHPAGDAVLKALCRLVEKQMRLEDVFARYGGEEFVLLMRETPLDAAMKITERLRKAISEMPVEHEGTRIQITTSMGVSSTAQGAATAPELFTQADQNLYLAKRTGRNRVCGPE